MDLHLFKIKSALANNLLWMVVILSLNLIYAISFSKNVYSFPTLKNPKLCPKLIDLEHLPTLISISVLWLDMGRPISLGVNHWFFNLEVKPVTLKARVLCWRGMEIEEWECFYQGLKGYVPVG